MKILLLNPDRSSTLPLEELLVFWPDHYHLLCAVVSRGGLPSLAGQIAEHDPEAGHRFIQRMNAVVALEMSEVKRANIEQYRSPVLSGILRARANDILGGME